MARSLALSSPAHPGAIAASATFSRLVAIILVLLPALFAVLTFQTQPYFQLQMRALSLPVRAAEALIVLLAMADGFSPFDSLRRLDRTTRVAAAVWVGSVGVAALFASFDPGTATMLAAGTLLHGLTALALCDRLRARGCAPALLGAGAWGLVGYAVVAAVSAVLLSRVAGFPWYYFGVGVTNVRQVAFYGLPVLGIALGLLAAHERPERTGRLFALLAVGIFLVCWSGGRAALGAAVVALALALLLAPPGARARIGALSAAATLVVLPLVQALSFGPLWGFRSLQRVVPQAGISGMDQYSSSRVQIWQWTWHDIVAQPWLGHGEGQFGWMITARSGVFYNHPHNVVLQMLYEWGVPGFCAVAVLAGRVLWRLRSLEREALRPLAPALCGFAGLAAMALLEGALYHPLPILFALLFLATIASATRPAEPAGGVAA